MDLPPGRNKLLQAFDDQPEEMALPLIFREPPIFLSFLRCIEKLVLDEKLNPRIVYWTNRRALHLLPSGEIFGTLLRECRAVTYFGEDEEDKNAPDQWCFLLDSAKLSLVVYGQQSLVAGSSKFRCLGSLYPGTMRRFYSRLAPRLHALNPAEALKFGQAGQSLEPKSELSPYIQTVQSAWPAILSLETAAVRHSKAFETNSPGAPVVTRYCINDRIPFAEGDFTEAANLVLLFARCESANNALKIDSISLLSGLFAARGTFVGRLLFEHGVDLTNPVRRSGSSTNSIAPLPLSMLHKCTFDPQSRRILSIARKASRTAGEVYVHGIHLFWAILTSGPSPARDHLEAVGIDMGRLMSDASLYLKVLRYEGLTPNVQFDALALNKLILDGAILLEDDGSPLIALPLESASGFDTDKLTADALAALEGAVNWSQKLGFRQFAARHLIAGLISSDSAAARYLKSWGLTLALVQEKTFALERDGLKVSLPAGEQDRVHKHMNDDVGETLSWALAMAINCHEDSVSSEHLLWALVNSDQHEMQLLFRSLGLDQKTMMLDCENLCRAYTHVASTALTPRYSPGSGPGFAMINRAGLLIFDVICEPSVGRAMDLALLEANALGINVVGGDLLLLGLLQISGTASGLLHGMGLLVGELRDLIAKNNDSFGSNEHHLTHSFDPELEKAFFAALKYSLPLPCTAISLEHLLIGLLKTNNKELLQILSSFRLLPSAVLSSVELPGKNTLASLIKNPTVADLARAVQYGASQKLQSVFWRMLCHDEYQISGLITLPRLMLALTNDRYSPVAAILLEVGLSRLDLAEQVKTSPAEPVASIDITVEQVKTSPAQPVAGIDITVEKVLTAAGALAVLLGHAEVGCEHVLLTIIAWQRQHKSARILPDPINLSFLEAQVYLSLAHYNGLPLTLNKSLADKFALLDASAKLLIARAIVVALNSGRSYLDTEHLFLACVQSALFSAESFGAEASWPGLEARVGAIIARYNSPVVPEHWISFSISVRLLSLIDQAISNQIDNEPATVSDAGVTYTRHLSVDRLLQALLSEPEGLVPVILQELGCTPQKLLDDLFRGFGDQNLASLLAFDLSVFSPQALEILKEALRHKQVESGSGPSEADNDTDTPPNLKCIDFLNVLLQSPPFRTLFALPPFDMTQVISELTAIEKADTFLTISAPTPNLANSAREMLIRAFLMRRVCNLDQKLILPGHMFLSILDALDADCTALLAKNGIEPERAKMLLHGYINKEGRSS